MSSRGRCASCSEPIDAGGAICARGRLYHLNHFCCEVCAYPIAFSEQGFVLSDGKLACMKCFRRLAPKCHNSSGRPLDRDCQWGQLLMDHVLKDVDNAVPTDY
uniref:LIM zinc-binding domain-containing protein n=1 Tax=Parascaris equorum TaxID=6256 RepID=A0A914RMP2_PAREQ